MSSNQVVVSNGASWDISQLAAGANRADVALQALNAENLSPEQIAALHALVRRYEDSAKPSATQETDPRVTLIRHAGGIVIGKNALIELGKLTTAAQIPEIPAKYSEAFLNSKHPIRDGEIAAYIIIGFDIETNQWCCIERSIVPGSRGLSGIDQDKLLQNENGSDFEVQGVRITSPKDSRVAKRLLDSAIALHIKDQRSISTLPFRGEWARTAETSSVNALCRTVLGGSGEHGSLARNFVHGQRASDDIGLLACWS